MGIHGGQFLDQFLPETSVLPAFDKDTVLRQLGDHGNVRFARHETLGQPLSECHTGNPLAIVFRYLVEVAAKPTVARGNRRWVTGLPYLHGSKMGLIGVGISDAVHNAHLAFLEQFGQRFHRGMQSEAIVEAVCPFLDTQAGPRFVVCRILEWNDGVQAVIPTVHLDYHHYAVRALRFGSGLGSVHKQGRRRGRPQGNERHSGSALR